LFATIICENFAPMSFGIMGEHGFAALIEADGKNILLDTGQGLGILNNAKLLGKKLDDIDTIVLSHGHRDHTGGLPPLLSRNKSCRIVAHPGVFDKKMVERKMGDKTVRLPIGIPMGREELEKNSAALQLSEGPVEVAPGIWFSGEIPAKNDFELASPELLMEHPEGGVVQDPFHDDAALFIRTGMGLSVISGCAHRGIVNTIARARDVVGDIPLNCVIGGMHLGGASEERIGKTIEALRASAPKIVAAGHCTSLESASLLREGLGKVFQFLAVGQRFEL